MREPCNEGSKRQACGGVVAHDMFLRMIDSLTILAILMTAGVLLFRQFRKGCGRGANNSGPSC
jgi:hypothetical protein